MKLYRSHIHALRHIADGAQHLQWDVYQAMGFKNCPSIRAFGRWLHPGALFVEDLRKKGLILVVQRLRKKYVLLSPAGVELVRKMEKQCAESVGDATGEAADFEREQWEV